jgi:DNA-binding NarL/FixJ family response regulator
VALLEPYCVLRDGLSAILQRMKGVCLIGEFDSLSRFLPWYPQQQIDVVVVGYHLHNVASMSWLQFCRRQKKGPAILVLNGLSHPRHARAVMDLGVLGVVDLRSNAADIAQAVRTVAAGRRYAAPDQVRSPADGLHALSEREFDVLMMTAMGFRLKEIAERMGVATQTAYSYRSRVRRKLSLKTPSDMVRYACDHGLLINDERGSALRAEKAAGRPRRPTIA